MQTGTRPKIGVLLITTPRFRNLGEQTEQGVFHKRKEREAQGILTELRTFSEVVFTSIVYTREDLRTAMKAFETEDVDMVFACFLSWSDDFAWIRFLRDMKPIPILFASIVRNKLGFSNSMNEDRFVEFLSAGTLVGTLEASGSIRRFQRPMLKHIVGTLAQVIAVCKPFAQAALLRSQLSQMHWALLPSLNEVMWSTYVDPYTLFMQVGCELHFLTITELKQLIEQMSDSLVSETTRMLQARYRCDDTVDQVKLEASVRASLALESLCRKHQVEVLVLNDIHPNLLEEVGLRPGFTPCPGTDDVLVVPEGDIGGALAVKVLKHFAKAPVQFVEPFHIDYEQDVFEAGHAGPNDYTDDKGQTIISRDERFAKTQYRYAGAPFAWHVIAAGEKTMLHISQCNNSFTLVCSVVDALPAKHHLAGYTHGVFKPRRPCTEFFQSIVEIGTTQHFAVTQGNHIAELEAFANLMQFEFHRI